MKKMFIILVVFSFGSTEINAQCSQYFDFQDGTEFEMQSFNPKGKKEGRTEYKISSYQGGSDAYIAKMDLKLYDQKDKLLTEPSLDISCSSGVYNIDMSGMIPQESLKAFESMETTVETDNLEIPSDLTVGDYLDNGYVEIKVVGSIPLSLRMDITDRKVEGREKVTTPAGTFNCYKITYKSQMKTIFTAKFTGVDYVAEGVGIVKSETFKSSGKSLGYTLLTRFKR